MKDELFSRSPCSCLTLVVSCHSEMLAWASAQIHCQFHASENRVALPARGNKQDVQAGSDTVLIPSRGEQHRKTGAIREAQLFRFYLCYKQKHI